jgi:DNA-binding transcriptional ArsR family regulator
VAPSPRPRPDPTLSQLQCHPFKTEMWYPILATWYYNSEYPVRILIISFLISLRESPMSQTDMGDPALPAGYASWDEVPDPLIPSKLVSWKGRDAVRPLAPVGFVKGPLRLDWIAAVSLCGPPKTLRVALALKAQADRQGSIWIAPPYAILRSLGVSAVDLSRCLSALERAGLIEAQRRRGRPSLVRLSPWQGEEVGGGARKPRRKKYG